MTTTWNPSDKTAGITLSSGNLVATGSSGNNGVRATTSKASGKWYLEYPAILNGGGGGALGFGLSTDTLGGTGQIYLDPSGNLFVNGSSFGAIFGGAPDGHNISWAIDFDNLKVWVRQDGGNWNADATANPATNTNGKAFTAGAEFPFLWLQNSPSNCTLNVGASAFTYGVPASFNGWDVPVAFRTGQIVMIG